MIHFSGNSLIMATMTSNLDIDVLKMHVIKMYPKVVLNLESLNILGIEFEIYISRPSLRCFCGEFVETLFLPEWCC